MSDVLDRLSSPTAPQPEGTRPRRRIPARGIAITLFLLVLGWWLFIADTAANNDLIEGFDVLFTGIGELPALVFNPDAYSSWWTWMSDAEGWSPIFERVVEHVQRDVLGRRRPEAQRRVGTGPDDPQRHVGGVEVVEHAGDLQSGRVHPDAALGRRHGDLTREDRRDVAE